jgi:multidrug transporter EmrE-like cation transporter
MSASVEVGLLLALATAFASVVGFLYKQRGAVESPTVELRRPVRTSLALFRSRWYVLGLAIAMGSWGLHVSALALAPISLVQSVIAGGLVLLTVTAHGLFDHEVTRREWLGVGLAALGLAFLSATIGGTGDNAYSSYDAWRLWPWVGALSLGAVVVAGIRRGNSQEGVILGASAGLFWAASDTSIKALTDHLGDGAGAVLLDPLAVVVAVASFAGLAVSARSLQTGKAVPVIAVTSVAANLFTIAAGPVVFGEPMPDTSLGVIARLLAFALVISAAALTPAPVRPAEPDTAN